MLEADHMLDALDVVEAKFGNIDHRFADCAAIFDLRDRASEFLAAVNDAQRSRMRNMQRRNGLTHVSSLPLAAKHFALGPLRTRSKEEVRNLVYALDLACYRYLYSGEAEERRTSLEAAHDGSNRIALTKRYESGLFVILPDDGGEGDTQLGKPVALAYERATVWPWIMSDEWWEALKRRDAEPPPLATDSDRRFA
jgi:hypothetical protein